jgi:hypothetical protein
MAAVKTSLRFFGTGGNQLANKFANHVIGEDASLMESLYRRQVAVAFSPRFTSVGGA